MILLVRRGTRPEVLRYCEEELVRRAIFHAVFEATKGLAARLRQFSGSTLDGSELVNHCFGAKGGTTPVLRINGYQNRVSGAQRPAHGGSLACRASAARDVGALRRPAKLELTRVTGQDIMQVLVR